MEGTTAKTSSGKLYVVCGPSGAGKSSVTRALVERTPIKLSVSATTRPQSPKEVFGQDYYFIGEKEFQERVAHGEFVEYARVFDHWYGTPAGPLREMLDRGETVILEIDVQGAAQVFERMPEAIGVFIAPPNEDELRRRLSERGRDDAATIEKRLAKAAWETEQARNNPNFKHIVVNNDLDETIEKVAEIMLGDKQTLDKRH